MKTSNKILLSMFLGLLVLVGFVNAGPSIPKDTTPPIISNVRTMQICGAELCGPLFVIWDTDETSYFNKVEYGRGKRYNRVVSQDFYGTNLTNISKPFLAIDLDKAGNYHYKVTSCDLSKNCATSEGYKVKA